MALGIPGAVRFDTIGAEADVVKVRLRVHRVLRGECEELHGAGRACSG